MPLYKKDRMILAGDYGGKLADVKRSERIIGIIAGFLPG